MRRLSADVKKSARRISAIKAREKQNSPPQQTNLHFTLYRHCNKTTVKHNLNIPINIKTKTTKKCAAANQTAAHLLLKGYQSEYLLLSEDESELLELLLRSLPGQLFLLLEELLLFLFEVLLLLFLLDIVFVSFPEKHYPKKHDRLFFRISPFFSGIVFVTLAIINCKNKNILPNT